MASFGVYIFRYYSLWLLLLGFVEAQKLQITVHATDTTNNSGEVQRMSECSKGIKCSNVIHYFDMTESNHVPRYPRWWYHGLSGHNNISKSELETHIFKSKYPKEIIAGLFRNPFWIPPSEQIAHWNSYWSSATQKLVCPPKPFNLDFRLRLKTFKILPKTTHSNVTLIYNCERNTISISWLSCHYESIKL